MEGGEVRVVVRTDAYREGWDRVFGGGKGEGGCCDGVDSLTGRECDCEKYEVMPVGMYRYI